MKEPDEGVRDPGLGEKTGKDIESLGLVVVKTHDHSAPDVEPVVLDASDALDKRSGALANVLVFLGLLQRGFVRTFDANEHALEARLSHQAHQLLVFGKIERGFGE